MNYEKLTDENSSIAYKGWITGLGIALMLLGIVTIGLSWITTTVVFILLGISLSIRGIIDTVVSFFEFRKRRFYQHLFGGIFSLIVGLLILVRPGLTAAVITFLIGAFLLTSGVIRAVMAPVEHHANWGWMMLGGVVSLILGIWVLAAWPAISLFLVGTIVGVEILAQGIAFTVLPFAGQSFHKPSGEAFARR
ncbi:MAG: HdeD family acid-resistance protein [Fibrobacter sp.]|nr:HdeD family acid-resistance protein [Fibrobacter sp.]